MIEWTKTYTVTVPPDSEFKILVSEAEGNLFSASCIWYEGSRVLRAPNETGGLSFKLESFAGTTELEAFERVSAWVKSKFGKNAEIVEVT